MSAVVDLDDYRPHEAGTAECRACHYRHVQVIPVAREPGGSECPRCGEFEVFFVEAGK